MNHSSEQSSINKVCGESYRQLVNDKLATIVETDQCYYVFSKFQQCQLACTVDKQYCDFGWYEVDDEPCSFSIMFIDKEPRSEWIIDFLEDGRVLY